MRVRVELSTMSGCIVCYGICYELPSMVISVRVPESAFISQARTECGMFVMCCMSPR